ncbi:hypothetical protein CU103_24650 [Phyllobacterium sophorae]|uniref:Uncharacterized protein n=1 Tax=Phyllobacterium sophorae TaxID=1520277 RepID=A0A2P7B3U7_9HYPH|nr:hypothetical protein CU103_24650 [Phyllobacterium sophorae]
MSTFKLQSKLFEIRVLSAYQRKGFSQLFSLNNRRQIHVLRHTPGQAMSYFAIVMDNCQYDQPRSYPPFTLRNSCTKLLKFSAFPPYALLVPCLAACALMAGGSWIKQRPALAR